MNVSMLTTALSVRPFAAGVSLRKVVTTDVAR